MPAAPSRCWPTFTCRRQKDAYHLRAEFIGCFSITRVDMLIYAPTDRFFDGLIRLRQLAVIAGAVTLPGA